MILKIKYLGYSSFYIESFDGVKVLTDPYNDNIGYTFPDNLAADIVLISHAHPGHNYTDHLTGNPALLQGPGYREIGWVKVTGLSSFHDAHSGNKFGSNTIFCWSMRAIKFCHFGDLGHVPDDDLLNKIGHVDFAFIPIGGQTTLSKEDLDILIDKLDVKYIIPMKYKTKYNDQELLTLGEFIKGKNNIIIPKPKDEFVIDRKTIAVEDKHILAMEYVETNSK